MRQLIRFIPAFLIFVGINIACQETEFGPKEGQFPENKVIAFEVEDQMGTFELIQFPSLDEENLDTIIVQLIPGTSAESVKIIRLEISAGSTVNGIGVDSILNMNHINTFTVTAQNGNVRTYVIREVIPIDITYKGQNSPITINGILYSYYDFLLLGQNRVQDYELDSEGNQKIDKNGNPIRIAFFRCNNPAKAPVFDNTGSTIHMTSNTDCEDDYFLFRSDGTYEFSFGKNRVSTFNNLNGVVKDDEVDKYVPTPGRGFWWLAAARDLNNNETTGLCLMDAATNKVTLLTSLISNASGFNFRNFWLIGTSTKRRMMYVFTTTLADKNFDEAPIYGWENWLTDETPIIPEEPEEEI